MHIELEYLKHFPYSVLLLENNVGAMNTALGGHRRENCQTERDN